MADWKTDPVAEPWQLDPEAGSVEEASTEFKLGSAIRANTPRALRSPLRIVGESTRIGQLPLITFDALFGTKANKSYDEFLSAAFGEANPIEKLIAAGVGGGTTGVMSKSIGPVRGAIAGMLGYPGGLVGGEAGKAGARYLGVPEKYGELPGTIIGSIASGSPTLLPGNTTAAQMAAESLKGYTPTQIREGIARQRDALRQGINLRPGQALGDAPDGARGVTSLEQEVLSTPLGTGQLESRVLSVPQSAQNAARRNTYQFGPYDESFIRTNQIRDAITSAMKEPQRAANELSKPFYEAAENRWIKLPVNERFAIIDSLKKIDDDLRVLSRSESSRAAGKVRRAVSEPSVILDPATGKPFDLANADTIKLSHYLDELDNHIKAGKAAAATPEQKSRMRAYAATVDDIKKRLWDANPALRAADEVYGTVARDMSSRIKATSLGDSVTKAEMQPGPLEPAARWNQFRKIIEEGTPDDVSRAATALRAHDPKAVRDIGLQWIEESYRKSFPEGMVGNPAKFADELLGNKNLDRVIQIVALESGAKDPNAVVNGFRAALGALRRASIPTAVPGKAADLAQIMSLNPTSTIGRLLVGNQLSRTNIMVSRIKYESSKNQYKKLYEALNDPDSLQKLSDLGKTSMVSPRFASLLSSIVGGGVSLDE